MSQCSATATFFLHAYCCFLKKYIDYNMPQLMIVLLYRQCFRLVVIITIAISRKLLAFHDYFYYVDTQNTPQPGSEIIN